LRQAEFGMQTKRFQKLCNFEAELINFKVYEAKLIFVKLNYAKHPLGLVWIL
jgi:hypothetical protein